MELEYIVFWGLCSTAVTSGLWYGGYQTKKKNIIQDKIYQELKTLNKNLEKNLEFDKEKVL